MANTTSQKGELLDDPLSQKRQQKTDRGPAKSVEFKNENDLVDRSPDFNRCGSHGHFPSLFRYRYLKRATRGTSTCLSGKRRTQSRNCGSVQRTRSSLHYPTADLASPKSDRC